MKKSFEYIFGVSFDPCQQFFFCFRIRPFPSSGSRFQRIFILHVHFSTPELKSHHSRENEPKELSDKNCKACVIRGVKLNDSHETT